MIPESPLESTEHGLVPEGDGWFVLNAREARWRPGEGRGVYCIFEGEPEFSQLGIHLVSLAPGEPMSMYHWEADQEDFLHHTILGAGDASCLVLAVGARDRSTRPDWGGYTVDEAAIRHGAGVEQETTKAEEAYARFPQREPSRYREGWLPD